MRQLSLPDGTELPVLGQGTWRMGEDRKARESEIAALQAGLDLGLRVIDTAEMYGAGGAEEIVGAAIAGRRNAAFVVSKVLPQNADYKGTIRACENSLRRLGIETLDLYLLHWRGAHPLAETLAAFLDLRQAGKIARFGISNFDSADMREWLALSGAAGTDGTQANQVMYNPAARGIDYDLLPQMRARRIAVMAYCPLGLDAQSREKTMRAKSLAAIAKRHSVDPVTIALAWTIREDGVIAIPKSSSLERLRANARAAELRLTAEDLAELDRDFPPPRKPQPLAMT